MKNLKKALSFVLAMVMVLGVSVSAMADTNVTVTGAGGVSAYQIFKGNVSGTSESSGGGTLANIQWGAGITESGKAALAAAFNLSGNYTPADVASEIKTAEDASKAAKALKADSGYLQNAETASTATVSVTKGDGYYLVVQNDSTGAAVTESAYLVTLVGTTAVTLTPKTGAPTISKKVQDKNDSKAGVDSADNWKDSADYDITESGDSIPFKITVTLPEKSVIETYDVYRVAITDTAAKGFTVPEATANDGYTVKLGDQTLTKDTDYTLSVTTSGDNSVITIKVKDIKALITKYSLTLSDNMNITVEYSAKLNSGATVSSEGNRNEAKITYENNPNATHSGDYIPDKTADNDVTDGNTDVNLVFVYKLYVNKVKQDGTSHLNGAKFTLYKYDLATSDFASVKTYSAADTSTVYNFAFSGLDDGIYKLVEDEAPTGYNKISEPIYFEITATHDETADTPALTGLTVFKGTWDDTQKTFTATESADTADNTFEVELTDDKLTGCVFTYVKNAKGAELPATGGMGTKVIYLIGGALVIAASVLLITKRRVGKH